MGFFFILLALFNGATVSLQQVMNAALGMRLGSLPSSFVNHVVGTLFAGFLLLAGIRTGNFHIAGVPLFYFLGGCLGMLAVTFANYAIPRIGVVLVTVLFTAFQLLTSALMDHFGWLGVKIPLTPLKVLGVIFLMVGAILVFAKRPTKLSFSTLQKST